MQDHERIEELLAGHALGALSGEDAFEADRVLAEHVPSCPLCREALGGFRAVADDLALAAAPRVPSELLGARIRRSIASERASRRLGAFVATAAGVAALIGMAALSVSLGTRADRAETHLDRMGELVDALSQPGAAPVSLSGVDATPMVEVTAPDRERIIVAGHGVPRPAEEFVYVIWVGTADGFRPLGRLRPDEYGFVYRSFTVDPSTFDRILITEERAGTSPAQPRGDSPHVWQASL